MNKRKNRAEFAAALDRRLSGLQAETRLAQCIIANEADRSACKKRSGAVVLALVLALAVTGVAFAATGGFGILDFHPEQAENKTYAGHIASISQTWAGEYLSASVNEAVFDGVKLSVTMSISPKMEDEPVFVIPRIRAMTNGQQLSVWVQSITGGYGADGFWIPGMIPNHTSSFDQIGIDVLLSEDGRNHRIIQDAVTWELTFDVLHPEWPIVFTEQAEPGIDEEPWTDEEYDAYHQQFADAYRQKRILLNRSAMLSPFACANPSYDLSMEDEMAYADWVEALLTQEAFTLTDRITFQFSTDPLPVKTAKEAVQFDLADGLHAELTALIVSVDHISFSFRISNDDSDKPLTMDDWRNRTFAVLADNATTQYLASSCGQTEDGNLLYTGHCMISGETDRLTVIPVEEGQEDRLMRERVIPDDLPDCAISRIELE